MSGRVRRAVRPGCDDFSLSSDPSRLNNPYLEDYNNFTNKDTRNRVCRKELRQKLLVWSVGSHTNHKGDEHWGRTSSGSRICWL